MFRFLDDDETKAKDSVLQEIIDLMDKRDGEKLHKPLAASLEVTKLDNPENTDLESDLSGEKPDLAEELAEGQSDGDENELSDEDKAKIEALYHRIRR